MEYIGSPVVEAIHDGSSASLEGSVMGVLENEGQKCRKPKNQMGKLGTREEQRQKRLRLVVKESDLQQESIVKAPFSTCDLDELGVVGWRRDLAVIAVKRVRV